MRNYFYRTRQGVGVTGSVVAISAPIRHPNTLIKYTHIVFVDETSDITSMTLGIRDPSGFHLLLYNGAPGLGIPVVFSNIVIPVVYPGTIEALVVGTTNADVLRLYLSGYEELPPKER